MVLVEELDQEVRELERVRIGQGSSVVEGLAVEAETSAA